MRTCIANFQFIARRPERNGVTEWYYDHATHQIIEQFGWASVPVGYAKNWPDAEAHVSKWINQIGKDY